MRKLIRAIAPIAALLPVACAPVFSDLQSARLLPKGAVEVTPQGTATWFSDPDESEHVQNHVGAQVAVGLSDRVELRSRYERILVGDDGGGANLVALGPKIGLVRDRLALHLPVGLAFAGDSESVAWATQPALIATFPLSETVELNPSVKYTIPINDADGFRGLALNLGLGLGPRDGTFAFRPEAGVMFAPDDVKYYQASFGLSFRPR
jgi:hypothetical protein